jgi:predicted phage tail protein
VRYACFIGRRNLGEDELARPAGNEDIRIAPMPTGAKRGGLMQVVVGVALIVASFIPGLNAIAWGAMTLSGAMASMGMAMALGGLVQMLSPQQRALSAKDGPNNGASYNFNGPVNTTAQGNPVPLLYGELIVGSATISAGIYSEDQG